MLGPARTVAPVGVQTVQPYPESGHHLRRVTPADPMVAALIPTLRSRYTSSRPRPRYKPTTRKRVGRRWPTRSDLAKPSASFLSWLRGKHPASRRAGGSSGERAPAAGPRCAGGPTLWLRRQILWPRWRGCGGPSTSQHHRGTGPHAAPSPRLFVRVHVRLRLQGGGGAGMLACFGSVNECGRSGRSGGSTRGVPRCVGTGWPGVGGRGVLRRRVHPSGERGIDRSGPGPQRPGDRPVWACGHRGVVDGGTSATVRAVPRLR